MIASHRFENFVDIADGMTIINKGKNILTGHPKEVLYSNRVDEFIQYPIAKIARQLNLISSYPLTSMDIVPAILSKIKNSGDSIDDIKATRKCIVKYLNLTYYYENGSLGVKGLNGAIPKRSITAIIGNNGSGKTTLTKLTLNLLKDYKGEINFLGRDIRSFERLDLAKNISYITQIPRDMFIEDTVRKECEFFPKQMKLKDYRQRSEKAINKVGLSNYLDSSIDSLSGGQSRLLSIAATILLSKSPLIVLDEPEYGIDQKTWDKIYNIILELKLAGASVVMLTHWLDITLFCDYIILMDDGKILKAGTPLEIYNDKELLDSIDMDIPPMYQLFRMLWKKGYKIIDYDSLLKAINREVV